MLVEAARRTTGRAKRPQPHVLQTALGGFLLRRVPAGRPGGAQQPRPRAEVLSRLHAHVQDVFNEYGVQIMSPHYLVDPAAPQVVAREQWYAAPAKPPPG